MTHNALGQRVPQHHSWRNTEVVWQQCCCNGEYRQSALPVGLLGFTWCKGVLGIWSQSLQPIYFAFDLSVFACSSNAHAVRFTYVDCADAEHLAAFIHTVDLMTEVVSVCLFRPFQLCLLRVKKHKLFLEGPILNLLGDALATNVGTSGTLSDFANKRCVLVFDSAFRACKRGYAFFFLAGIVIGKAPALPSTPGVPGSLQSKISEGGCRCSHVVQMNRVYVIAVYMLQKILNSAFRSDRAQSHLKPHRLPHRNQSQKKIATEPSEPPDPPQAAADFGRGTSPSPLATP